MPIQNTARITSFRLPPKVDGRLNMLAKRYKVTRTSVLIDLIELYHMDYDQLRKAERERRRDRK